MSLLRALLLLAAASSLPLAAQTAQLPNAPGANLPNAPGTPAAPAPLPSRPVVAALRPYISCKLPLGPDLVQHTRDKGDLISEFDRINATGEDTQRNYDLKPTLNGFEIYGFDRTALDGNVLGIYLFFDNVHHVATTAYFLNAPQGQRKFNNVAEYDQAREAFLNAYTVCVRKELGGGGAPAKAAPPKRKAR